MADALTGIALIVLAITAFGLFRVLRSAVPAECMMAVQLLGTGGAAALLLLSVATAMPALIDVSLLLTLLAAFSCAAFTLGHSDPEEHAEAEEQP